MLNPIESLIVVEHEQILALPLIRDVFESIKGIVGAEVLVVNCLLLRSLLLDGEIADQLGGLEQGDIVVTVSLSKYLHLHIEEYPFLLLIHT